MATKEQIAANRKNAKLSTGPSTDAGKARSAMNSRRHGLLGEFHLIEGEDPREFSQFAEETRTVLKPESAIENYYADRWIKDAWRLNRLDNAVSALLVNQESLDDLSLGELLNVLKFLDAESGRRFDELPQIVKFLEEGAFSDDNPKGRRRNNLDVGSKAEAQSARTEELFGVYAELSSFEVLKQLNDRLHRASLTTNRAYSEQTPTETDGAEGERRALSTRAAINTMARSFARNREAITLALRYRTKIERSRDNALHELQRFQAAR